MDNNLPKMRLLENVMAAVTPGRELLDAYFKILENLRQQGKIKDDEVALLRLDIFAKKELMELTCGNSDNVTEDVIEKIRNKIKAESFSDGVEQGKQSTLKEYQEQNRKKRNNICLRAEQEVEREYAEKEKTHKKWIKFIAIVVAVIFVIASIISFCSQWNNSLKIPLLIVTIITTFEGVQPFFYEENFLIRLDKNRMRQQKLFETDLRKEKYLSVLDEKSDI